MLWLYDVVTLRQLQLHEREAALVVRCERVDQLTMFN